MEQRDSQGASWGQRRRLSANAIFFLFVWAVTVGPLMVGAVPLTGAWSLWASSANGVPYGAFPTLAYAPETQTLFYSTRYTPSPTDTLGSVWSCRLE